MWRHHDRRIGECAEYLAILEDSMRKITGRVGWEAFLKQKRPRQRFALSRGLNRLFFPALQLATTAGGMYRYLAAPKSNHGAFVLGLMWTVVAINVAIGALTWIKVRHIRSWL
jgi:hypothetical protein